MLSATIVHSSIHTNVSRSYVCVLVRIRLILCVRFSRFSLHLQFVCFCVGVDQAVYYLNDIKKQLAGQLILYRHAKLSLKVFVTISMIFNTSRSVCTVHSIH